ncbi:MAG TPA: DUF3426 domain-containing protein [Caulobacteraceae bacterium]|nr:DUF3426 domain-containing protein [Caulobacteraceae bacterium]
MILTCPECASRYFVADGSIGEAGRTVRCSSCGARWTARTDDAEQAPAAPSPPKTEPVAVESAPPEPVVDETGEPLPKVFRERAATRQKVREAAAAGAVWGGLLAAFVLLVVATIVLRQDIARLWPRTAGAYAMIGFPVNLVGLVVENPVLAPQLQDGHAALVVSGSLRNIRDRPVAAPPLKISLLNPAGKPLAVKIADPCGARIPPGEARRFAVDMLDPPVGATDVDIAFVLDRPSIPHPVGAPAPSRLSLRGADLRPSQPSALGPVVPSAAARDATPLPSSSPYALPKANDPDAGPRG